MFSERSKDVNMLLSLVVLFLLYAINSCITLKETEIHNPFFDYIEQIQKEAILTRAQTVIPFAVYTYKTDEVLNYNQSEEGDLIFISKPIHLLQSDKDNLKAVCDSCSDKMYIEKLKDGRRVEYTIKEEDQKYILQIEVFSDERKN